MPYQMPVKAIKRILGEELEKFRSHILDCLRKNYTMSDVPSQMVDIAYENLKGALENCQTYDELDSYVSAAGYRMSLEEWINSL